MDKDPDIHHLFCGNCLGTTHNYHPNCDSPAHNPYSTTKGQAFEKPSQDNPGHRYMPQGQPNDSMEIRTEPRA